MAFFGVDKGSVVSIGSYGCVKTGDEKRHFRAGLEAMLNCIEPEAVLVYGSMPEDVFRDFESSTEFVHHPDWTTYIKAATPDSPKAARWAPGQAETIGLTASVRTRFTSTPRTTREQAAIRGVQ